MDTLLSAPKPTLRQRKIIAWILLGLNVGATLLFAILFSFKGPLGPRERWFYLWPVITALGVIFSTLSLKRSYRTEPESFSGFWHLSIIDFYAVTVFTALLMAAFRAAWPSYFIPTGAITALFFAIIYLFCLLISARMGTTGMPQKYVRALCFLLLTLGWMSVGSVAIVCIVMTLSGDALHMVDFAEHLVDVRRNNFLTEGILVALRVGLLGLPIAHIINRRLREPATDQR